MLHWQTPKLGNPSNYGWKKRRRKGERKKKIQIKWQKTWKGMRLPSKKERGTTKRCWKKAPSDNATKEIAPGEKSRAENPLPTPPKLTASLSVSPCQAPASLLSCAPRRSLPLPRGTLTYTRRSKLRNRPKSPWAFGRTVNELRSVKAWARCFGTLDSNTEL